MKSIRTILVDDHQIVRDGIKSLLLNDGRIEIIGEVGDAASLFEILEKTIADVVVMDISLPDMSGIDATRKLKERYPEVHVLMLSMHTGEDFIQNAIKAGARGYLLKNTTKTELLDAIHAVSEGEEYLGESISQVIMKSYFHKMRSSDDVTENLRDKLTSRELEILKMAASGIHNQDIAEKLFISIRTVESHKNHIMQKLKLTSMVDLIKLAIKEKIIEI